MNRRKFILFTTASIFGIIFGSPYIHKFRLIPNLPEHLINKFRISGFSIRCGLAATKNKFVDEMSQRHFIRMEFGQVLVDNIFINESELNKALNVLKEK